MLILWALPRHLRLLVPASCHSLTSLPSCAIFSFFNCSIFTHNLGLLLLTTKNALSDKTCFLQRGKNTIKSHNMKKGEKENAYNTHPRYREQMETVKHYLLWMPHLYVMWLNLPIKWNIKQSQTSVAPELATIFAGLILSCTAANPCCPQLRFNTDENKNKQCTFAIEMNELGNESQRNCHVKKKCIPELRHNANNRGLSCAVLPWRWHILAFDPAVFFKSWCSRLKLSPHHLKKTL